MTQSFRLLKELLSRLSKKEVTLLKKKLASGADNEDKKKNKSKHLVSLILSDPSITEVMTGKEIYGNPNKIAFAKLAERTIDRIDEIYIGFNKDNSSFNSERNYYFFSLKRKLLIIQMRWMRGIDFDLGMQFEKIITISKKYELYELLIEVLYAKQRFVGFRYGKNAFNKIDKEIIKYEYYRTALHRARNHFTKLGANIMQTLSSENYEIELKESIAVIKKDFNQTGSATVGYYLYCMQTQWLHIYRKYKVAELILQKLLNLVVNNPSVYTSARHGDVIVNISNNNIFLRNFKPAIQYAVLSKAFYANNSVSLDLAKEIEFYARFYNGELDHAEKIIEEIYNSSRKGNSPFIYGKRAYLFACIKTIKGDIKKSNELLLEAREIEKNKGGWNIAKRILTIINCIEAKDYESADLKVMNLEKFIKRNAKLHQVRKRDVIILRILLKLINEGFDFKKVYKQRKRYFELLESNDPEYAWKIKSPELIVFHEWFKNKMATRKV